MSRAFVKEGDGEVVLPERAVSLHPNFVTANGLAQIDERVRALEVARFGVAVTLRDAAGATRVLRIVGEDEADPARGLISWVSPAAEILIGARVADEVTVAGQCYEIGQLAP